MLKILAASSIVTLSTALTPEQRVASSTALTPEQRVASLNEGNPYATFDVSMINPENKGGCYTPPPLTTLIDSAKTTKLSFTQQELDHARSGNPSIDWRDHGAVGPVQQQHPYGTCWAFSMTAVTEAVNVIQGKNKYQKLSEQQTISCVDPKSSGDNADVLWSWNLHNTGGKYQTDEMYPYNRTCNFFREQQLAPDGTEDGYKGTCNLPGPPPYAPCPPCAGVARKDGTPACNIDKSKGWSKASVQGWGFVSPHGLNADPQEPYDVTRMVAALIKYGPAQIGIDASCVEGYKSGIITNCTSRNVDHAVAIIGAGTSTSGIDYWIVRNSWNSTFGMDGYFKVQRDTNQMGLFGGYYGCYDKDCMIDP